MKKISKAEILIWALALLPLAGCLVAGPFLPREIPMHWNASGQVDRYGGYGELLLLAASGFGIALLLKFVPRLDPKRANYQKFSAGYTAIRLCLGLFYTFMVGLTLATALIPEAQNTLGVDRLCIGAMGIVFCVIGNFMPKFKHNYFCGVRVPWTLASEDNWRRTHRFAGPVWFCCGLGIFVCAFLFQGTVLSVITFLWMLPLVAPTVYSYWIFRRAQRGEDSPHEK